MKKSILTTLVLLCAVRMAWADAVIDGDTVVVSNPEVKKPVAVRYAWELFPLCNLYNGAGLPASPGLILLATQHLQDQLINREGTQRTQKESE